MCDDLYRKFLCFCFFVGKLRFIEKLEKQNFRFFEKPPPPPEKLLKVGGGVAVKLAKTPLNLAQITRWNSATPIAIVFLTIYVRKTCNLLPQNVAVLIAIRLRFTVANYSFSTREKNVMYCLKNSNSTICAKSCREAV